MSSTPLESQGFGNARPKEERSFLKWAGGKSRYAYQLATLVPPFEGRYIEPFMGSAALFFELRPARATLADANQELVICFQQVAQDPETLMHLLDQMPNNPEFFKDVRQKDPHKLPEIERAARVIYLNKTAFRGLWRVNKKGQFNVPYGAYDRPYYNKDTLLNASMALQRMDIECQDFAAIVDSSGPGDFVYLDPPYIPSGGYSDFKRYTSLQFGEEDHHRLADAMARAAERGAFVMSTNSDTALTRKIFSKFEVLPIKTRRDINLQAGNRASSDLVFTNYDTDETLFA